MKELLNSDNVFIRTIQIGLVSTLYEAISIGRVRDGIEERIPVPFFFLDGNSQFMRDYYENPPKYCKELDPKVTGNMERLPLGTIKLEDIGAVDDELGSKYVRAVYQKEIKTEMGTQTRLMSARTRFIPQQLSFACAFRTSSELDKQKLYEETYKKLYKTIKFKIRYQGFHALPCIVVMPDSMSGIGRDARFSFPPDDTNARPETTFSMEVRAYLPDIDYTTERHYENKMSSGILFETEINK